MERLQVRAAFMTKDWMTKLYGDLKRHVRREPFVT